MSLTTITRGEPRRLVVFFTQLPRVVSLVTALGGALVLLGWSMNIPVLTGGIGDKPAMRPIAALSFILAALALYLAQFRERKWVVLASRALGAAVGVIALIVILEFTLAWDSGLGSIFPEGGGTPRERPTGAMALNTAITFLFFAIGFQFLEHDRKTNGLKSQVFATLALIVATLALVGYAFDVQDFYSFHLLAGMSLYSAIAFSLLVVALLFSNLGRGIPALVVDDGAAGFVTRRLLPGVLLLPFAFTMIRVAAEDRGLIGRDLGASLVAVADIVAFLLLIAWSARVLRAIDRRRGELLVLEQEARRVAETARVEAEAAMQQAEAARAEAERADRAKSDFLAVMSHELRTPLAAIMGYQELLADGITGPVNEQQAQQLARIKASARHLLSLIDEVLTFTRLDAGREKVSLDQVDLHALLRETAELIEPLAHAKRVEVNVDSPGEGLIVTTDPTKVRQMLVNLLSNAVKFTESGGRVSLSGRKAGDCLQLAVSDTGIGIPPEFHKKIFEPFWQVEQKATRRASGTGLGLTVTRRLANLLGGDVTVTSEPGEGTTFTVILPWRVPDIRMATEPAARLRAG